GGVNPRKAGQTVSFEGGAEVPVYGTVAEAMAATGANVSVVFVPPKFAKAAALEAIDAAIELLVIITEGIPVKDSAEFFTYSQAPTDRASSDPASTTPRSPHPTSQDRARWAWPPSTAP